MVEMTSMDCAKLRTSRAAFLMILLCGFSCAWLQAQSDKAAGDLTFRSHTTVCDKPISDNVLMIKNGKFRLETRVGSRNTAVDIYDCPGRRRIQVNDSNRTFLIRELGAPQLHQASLESEPPEAEVTRILDLHDTGERKDFFGYSARHIKGTIKRRSLIGFAIAIRVLDDPDIGNAPDDGCVAEKSSRAFAVNHAAACPR